MNVYARNFAVNAKGYTCYEAGGEGMGFNQLVAVWFQFTSPSSPRGISQPHLLRWKGWFAGSSLQ